MSDMKKSELSETQVRIIFFVVQIWSKNPMLRFNQLVDNLQAMCDKETGNTMRRIVYTGKSDFDTELEFTDAFYLQDEVFLKWLESYAVRIGLGLA